MTIFDIEVVDKYNWIHHGYVIFKHKVFHFRTLHGVDVGIEVKIIQWNKTSMSLQPKQELLASFPSLSTRKREVMLLIWKEHMKGKTWINIPKNYMEAPETGEGSKDYWVNEAKEYGYEIAPVEQVQKTKKWMEGILNERKIQNI